MHTASSEHSWISIDHHFQEARVPVQHVSSSGESLPAVRGSVMVTLSYTRTRIFIKVLQSGSHKERCVIPPPPKKKKSESPKDKPGFSPAVGMCKRKKDGPHLHPGSKSDTASIMYGMYVAFEKTRNLAGFWCIWYRMFACICHAIYGCVGC